MTDTPGAGAAAQEPIDLTSCDREPIHIPGSIQPHGALLALQEPGLRPVSVSASIAAISGLAPEEALAMLPREWMTPDTLRRLAKALEGEDLALFNPIRIDFADPAEARSVRRHPAPARRPRHPGTGAAGRR